MGIGKGHRRRHLPDFLETLLGGRHCAFVRFFNNYKSNAKAACLPFSITETDLYFLSQLNCYYCGCAPSTKFKGNRKELASENYFIANGVDRIDSSLGYTTVNIRPCCPECNSMKSNRSYVSFLEKVKLIAANLLEMK